jgi:hypothetical protein
MQGAFCAPCANGSDSEDELKRSARRPKIDAAVVPVFLVRPGSMPGCYRARSAYAVGDPHAMANVARSQAIDGVPTYLEGGDPATDRRVSDMTATSFPPAST